MGQYYYVPDPGEQQRGGYVPAIQDRLAQLRAQQMQGPQMPQQAQPMQPPMMCGVQNGMIWVSGRRKRPAGRTAQPCSGPSPAHPEFPGQPNGAAAKQAR